MIKNAFYFILKAPFLLKILNFCFDNFGHVRKRFDKKVRVSFKTYDVINWETTNCNTHMLLFIAGS